MWLFKSGYNVILICNKRVMVVVYPSVKKKNKKKSRDTKNRLYSTRAEVIYAVCGVMMRETCRNSDT